MKPGLLLASPQMRDPFFEGSLILLCHHDEQGSLGLVINRETNLTLGQVLEQMHVEREGDLDQHVLWGGPVEPGAGFVVSQADIPVEEGWSVGHGIGVSPSRDHLLKALEAPPPFHLCLGYAGWGAGQLGNEFERGSWLHTELDPAILFDTPIESRYDRALARLGLRADQVWMQPIDE